jgi:phosphoglucosamine mutase
MLKEVKLFPQILLNLPIKPDEDWQKNAEFKRRTAEVTQLLSGQGRLLIRASGTEPLLRIMVEAKQGIDVKPMAQYLAEAFDI